MTPAGYSFDHTDCIHKNGGNVGILFRGSLTCVTQLRF